MIDFISNKWFKRIFLIMFLTFFITIDVYASTTGSLPFNSAIDRFQQSFLGWAFGAAVVLWIGTCLMLAFGEWGQGMKQIINIIFWLSLGLGGASGIQLMFTVGAVF